MDQPPTKNSHGCVKTAVVIIILILLLVVGCRCHRHSKQIVEPSPVATPSPTPKETTPPPAVAKPTPNPFGYDVEAAFIQSVKQQENAYPNSTDDAGRAYTRDERRRGISNALPGVRTLVGWTGTLRKMQTSVDGKAAITIDLPGCNIVVQTWGNPVSDAGAGTLIEKNSDLYQRLAKLPAGAPVSFDGEFLEDKLDWVKEGSATASEGMTSPKFIVRFTDVKSLGK